MPELSLNNIEEELSKLTIEELLELEEKIIRAIKQKTKAKKLEDWRDDFLSISAWEHLKDDEPRVKINK